MILIFFITKTLKILKIYNFESSILENSIYLFLILYLWVEKFNMKFIRKIIPILVFFISCSLQTHATETSNIIYQRFLNNLKVDSSKFKIELNNNNLDSLTGDKFTIKICKSEQTIENFYCDTNKIYFLDKKEPVNYIAVNNVFYIPYFSLFQNKIEVSITK